MGGPLAASAWTLGVTAHFSPSCLAVLLPVSRDTLSQENDKSPKSVVGDIVRLGGGEVGGFRGLRVASCQAQEAIPIFPASSFLQLALTLALVAAQRRSLSRSLDAKKIFKSLAWLRGRLAASAWTLGVVSFFPRRVLPSFCLSPAPPYFRKMTSRPSPWWGVVGWGGVEMGDFRRLRAASCQAFEVIPIFSATFCSPSTHTYHFVGPASKSCAESAAANVLPDLACVGLLRSLAALVCSSLRSSRQIKKKRRPRGKEEVESETETMPSWKNKSLAPARYRGNCTGEARMWTAR